MPLRPFVPLARRAARAGLTAFAIASAFFVANVAREYLYDPSITGDGNCSTTLALGFGVLVGLVAGIIAFLGSAALQGLGSPQVRVVLRLPLVQVGVPTGLLAVSAAAGFMWWTPYGHGCL
ncbi:MAG TPA: hypothetical protein VMD91_11845 [Candidatus Sulfotelmatobacter sp.]|nr:hypothetical protein [Candidatus Sulfotelmatobacter sp.]